MAVSRAGASKGPELSSAPCCSGWLVWTRHGNGGFYHSQRHPEFGGALRGLLQPASSASGILSCDLPGQPRPTAQSGAHSHPPKSRRDGACAPLKHHTDSQGRGSQAKPEGDWEVPWKRSVSNLTHHDSCPSAFSKSHCWGLPSLLSMRAPTHHDWVPFILGIF